MVIPFTILNYWKLGKLLYKQRPWVSILNKAKLREALCGNHNIMVDTSSSISCLFLNSCSNKFLSSSY